MTLSLHVNSGGGEQPLGPTGAACTNNKRNSYASTIF